MLISHIALYNETVEDCEKFYGGLLRMKRLRSFTVVEEMSESLFGVSESYEVIHYEKDGVVFEIFAGAAPEMRENVVSHTCLTVRDRHSLIVKARDMGFAVTVLSRDGGDLVFLRDGSGNIFEMKQE